VNITDFATRLLAWFDQHGRHDLPWQHPRDPYRVWVSEIMLQQTQVRTVIGYFARFIERFPTLPALAEAQLDDVFAAWSGLGYYTRARNLQRAAQICVAQHGGELPVDLDALTALPGIGRSTAAAILAQALGLRHAILDGNVRRVLARHRHIGGDPASPAVQARLWAASAEVLPEQRLADYTQALMDLGATVCRRAQPLCASCPLASDCAACKHGDQNAYPTPRSRRPRPLKSCTQLLLLDPAGRLLLRRRAPVGIWAGLWSLVEAPSADAALVDLGLETGVLSDHTQLRHEFTHYSLDIDVKRSTISEPGPARDDTRWYTRDEALALGLPQPVRRLIEDLSTI
jgi:A/G-specific adenine glycosylase